MGPGAVRGKLEGVGQRPAKRGIGVPVAGSAARTFLQASTPKLHFQRTRDPAVPVSTPAHLQPHGMMGWSRLAAPLCRTISS